MVRPPGDKSVSHRAAILNAIAHGAAAIENFATGADFASTLRVLSALGIHIQRSQRPGGGGEILTVHGAGALGLQEPADVLDAGNSGTTIRLMSGLLAGRDFPSVLTGDDSLRSRPMGRIIEPLSSMGAHIHGRSGDRFAPLVFAGGELQAIDYQLPVASAQVKSCILLAGLRAQGETIVHSPAISRDHSERMLHAMGAHVETEGMVVSVRPSDLSAIDVAVPGDVSSAAFWLIAGIVHPDAEVNVENVGLNPTRTGVLTVLEEMGADIRVRNRREAAGEPVGDLVARSSALRGIEIGGDLVPLLIDEIPVLCVAAALAEGETVVRDAEELRAKETDRISASAQWLRNAGIDVEERRDGMVIQGGRAIRGADCDSFGDHRMAMAQAVAGLVSEGPMRIQRAEAADISYPSFWRDLEALGGSVG